MRRARASALFVVMYRSYCLSYDKKTSNYKQKGKKGTRSTSLAFLRLSQPPARRQHYAEQRVSTETRASIEVAPAPSESTCNTTQPGHGGALASAVSSQQSAISSQLSTPIVRPGLRSQESARAVVAVPVVRRAAVVAAVVAVCQGQTHQIIPYMWLYTHKTMSILCWVNFT